MLKTPIKRKVILLILVVTMIYVLWSVKVAPSGLCVLTAKVYVIIHYPSRNFKYDYIEYTSVFGDYSVHFVDKYGNKLALMTAPFIVIYDPLDPPC